MITNKINNKMINLFHKFKEDFDKIAKKQKSGWRCFDEYLDKESNKDELMTFLDNPNEDGCNILTMIYNNDYGVYVSVSKKDIINEDKEKKLLKILDKIKFKVELN